MMGMFIWIPMIIDQFEQAFEESNMWHDKKSEMRTTNAIIASFVMLDFNEDHNIDMNEFRYLVRCSVLVDKRKLFEEFDTNKSDGLDINEYVDCLLKQSLRTKIMTTSSHVPQLKWTAWFECNVFRNQQYTMYIFVFLVIPVIAFNVIKGLNHQFSDQCLDWLMLAFFCFNMIEIHFRMFCFGVQRFWDLLKHPIPFYVAAAINNYHKYNKNINHQSSLNLETVDIERLTARESNWVTNNLKEVRPLSVMEKSTQTLINRIEIVVFWVTLILFVVFQLLFFWEERKQENVDKVYGNDDIPLYIINDRYTLHFIEFACILRIFTLIPANKKLIYMVCAELPKFMALFAFLGLYIYSWARLGCTLFGDNITNIVIPEIYDVADGMVANFNSLHYAVLALAQLMIGEGWHEVMYFNTIATTQFYSLYFILYITAVSIIIANVLVGLFLADIDEIRKQQSMDELMQFSTKNKLEFQQFANQKLNKLYYQIDENEQENQMLTQQIEHIKDILNNINAQT